MNYLRERKVFPGARCLFLEDGSLISSSDHSITLISPAHKVVWDKPGIYHHQINLSSDGKRILTLKSEVVERDGKKVRDDVFEVLDMSGRVLFTRRAVDVITEAGEKLVRESASPILRDLKADEESGHFNSIYEIPENRLSKSAPALAAGNIIVNSLWVGYFILTPDLKKVLHHRKLTTSYTHEVHDVQVTKDGRILLFNNFRVSPGEKIVPHSAIQTYDLDGKLTFDYHAKEKELFYSPTCGSVQDMGEYFFIGHIVMGGYFYSKAQKKILLAVPGPSGDIRDIRVTQQLKLVNVTSFLKNSQLDD